MSGFFSRRAAPAGALRGVIAAIGLAGTALLLAGCGGSTVTLRQMVGKADYLPPQCNANPCVLTGLGGVVHVWERHVDRQLALGRSFIVTGVCASACEIAARRAHARIQPGARLIPHTPVPTVFS